MTDFRTRERIVSAVEPEERWSGNVYMIGDLSGIPTTVHEQKPHWARAMFLGALRTAIGAVVALAIVWLLVWTAFHLLPVQS